jgi:hypothetical protein
MVERVVTGSGTGDRTGELENLVYALYACVIREFAFHNSPKIMTETQ